MIRQICCCLCGFIISIIFMSRLRSAGSDMMGNTSHRPPREFTERPASKFDVLKGFQDDYISFRHLLDKSTHRRRDTQTSAEIESLSDLVRKQNNVISDLNSKIKQDRQSFMGEIDSLRHQLTNRSPSYAPIHLPQPIPQPQIQPPQQQYYPPPPVPLSNPYQKPPTPKKPPTPVPSSNKTDSMNFHTRPLMRRHYKLKKYVLAIIFAKYYRRLYREFLNARRNQVRLYFKDRLHLAIQDMSRCLLPNLSFFLSNFLDPENVDLDCNLAVQEDPQLHQSKIKYMYELMDALLTGMKQSCSAFSYQTIQFFRMLCHPRAFFPNKYLFKQELTNMIFQTKEGFARLANNQCKLLLSTLIIIRVLLPRFLKDPAKIEPSIKPTQNFNNKVWMFQSFLYQVLLNYIQKMHWNTYGKTGFKRDRGNYKKVVEKFRLQEAAPISLKGGLVSASEMVGGCMSNLDELVDYAGGKPLVRLIGIIDQFNEGLLIRIKKTQSQF